MSNLLITRLAIKFENKASHYCDCVWIFDVIYYRFYDLFLSFLVLSSIEKINQTKITCLTKFLNTSKFVKNVFLCVLFSAIFLMFSQTQRVPLPQSIPCFIQYNITADFSAVYRPGFLKHDSPVHDSPVVIRP